MSSLIARNFAGLNLTPAERGLVKLAKTIFFGAAAFAFVNLGPISAWIYARGLPPQVAGAFVVLVTAVITAWDKYSTAQGDQPLTASYELTPAGLHTALATQAAMSAAPASHIVSSGIDYTSSAPAPVAVHVPALASAPVVTAAAFVMPDPALLASIQSPAPTPAAAPTATTDTSTTVASSTETPTLVTAAVVAKA